MEYKHIKNTNDNINVGENRDETMKWPWSKSIMEMYPEYGFRPTSLVPSPRPVNIFLLIGVASLCVVFSHIIVLYGAGIINELSILDVITLDVIPSVILITISIVFIWKGNKEKQRRKNTPTIKLVEVADYIQCKGKCQIRYPYAFFVKDHKFGLIVLKIGGEIKVLIPAIYDKLSWKEKGKILIVERNNQTYMIDIYGNRLS